MKPEIKAFYQINKENFAHLVKYRVHMLLLSHKIVIPRFPLFAAVLKMQSFLFYFVIHCPVKSLTLVNEIKIDFLLVSVK